MIRLTDEEIAQAMHYPEVTKEARDIAKAQLKKVGESNLDREIRVSVAMLYKVNEYQARALESEWQALLEEAK